MENSTQLDQYQATALTIYNRLTNSQTGLLMNSTNYWQAGNVFDTVTDFMLTALQQQLLTPSQVSTVMSSILSNYDLNSYSYNGNPGDWYDDFGWWGIASSKAYYTAYSPVFGTTATSFQAIARSCWTLMTNGKPGIDNGAPNVWKNAKGQSCTPPYTQSQVEPYFPGGVWQYDMNCEFNPLTSYLGPFQLSVVNGLYFVLSLRLASVGGPGVSTAFQNEHKFLINWCFGKNIINNKSLLFKPAPAYGLILERVPIYKNGDQVFPASWAKVNASWCGDQGLMMGGMAEYLTLFPADGPASELVNLIANGVANMMVSNNVISAWYPIADNPLYGYDPGDYASGSGVFMRYLLYAYKNNLAIKKQVNTPASPLRNLIFNSANACLGPNPSFPVYGNALFDQFNMLSTLTTAINVLATESELNPEAVSEMHADH